MATELTVEEQQAVLQEKAEESLMVLLAHLIRNGSGYDPDHGGPEDVAEAIALSVVEHAIDMLGRFDPRYLSSAVR
jgi:hypothetical protein